MTQDIQSGDESYETRIARHIFIMCKLNIMFLSLRIIESVAIIPPQKSNNVCV